MKKMRKFILMAICTLLIVTGCSTTAFSMGSWEGNVYTNDFLGLTYTMPEDWTRTSDEELEELIEQAADLMDLSDNEKKLADLKAIYYLMTKDSVGNNAILGSEKVSGSTSAKVYAESLKTQLESQESLGYELSDIKTETVDGKEFVIMGANVTLFKQKYYIYKVDNYMVYICITGYSDEEINEIVEHFEFN